jgi:hypothetical protein
VRYPSAAPKHWARSIQTALIHVMSLAHYALVHTRSWAANSSNVRVRLSAKADQHMPFGGAHNVLFRAFDNGEKFGPVRLGER